MSFTHQIMLHFRSLTIDFGFESHLQSTKKVFAQYGIDILFGSGMTFNLTEEEQKKYAKVSGECVWTVSSGDLFDLLKLDNDLPKDEIIVYYIKDFQDPLIVGCGGHIKDRPACIVASDGSKWDTAHEISHVLLTESFRPVHSTDRANLMHEKASTYKNLPILTTEQVSKIKSSILCKSK